jgi:hypothetical protein
MLFRTLVAKASPRRGRRGGGLIARAEEEEEEGVGGLEEEEAEEGRTTRRGVRASLALDSMIGLMGRGHTVVVVAGVVAVPAAP